jgi:membrane protease subunit HflK
MAEIPQSPDELNRPETVDAGSQALSEALRSSFSIVKFVMFVLVCVFLGSGFFTVGPQERAIIIRLGKPVGEGEKALLGPGLHWSYPYPIDEYIKIPITAIQKATSTVGWYAVTREQELAGMDQMSLPVSSPINPLVDGYVMTADANIIHSRATLTYHIEDPIRFIFNFANASNAVQTALDNALLSSAAQFKVDDIITRDVAGFKEAVRRRVAELVDREHENLGIAVEDCTIQSRPPRQLQDGFASVLKAEVLRGKVLNDAISYQNQVTNRALADAQSRINAAESDKVRLVQDVSSQAERFTELLPKYRQNPALFVQQRLSETLGRVLTNVQDKIFLTEGADGNRKEFRMLLNREVPKNKPALVQP